MEIVKKLGRKLICRVPALQLINDNFVSNLPWPEGIDKYVVFFNDPIGGELEVLSKISGVDRVWIIYSVIKDKIEAGTTQNEELFIETDLPNAQELADLFSETRAGYYLSINRALTERQVLESKAFIEKVLPGTRRVCLRKGGKPVALLMSVEAKDYEDTPVDWIPWVWIEKDLSPAERKAVHRRFRQWLTVGRLERVQCSVSAGNARSQRFFRKLGFNPECIHILK